MEFLRKLILQTRNHLKGLALSQQIAIGLCVTLVAISLLWLVSWAKDPVRVPLLDQPMAAEELGQIEEHLQAMGVDYELKGSVITVPAENRSMLLAKLHRSRILPDDFSLGFEKLIEENSPWLNMEEQGWRRSVALSNEISRVLVKMDGVRYARVLIDNNTKRTIGAPSVVPTASIFVKLSAGKSLDRDLVFALASFVSGAVAGLDASQVSVVDATTGRSYTVPKSEDGMVFDDIEDRQKKEEYFANKIKELLANIPGVLVAVHAELDVKATTETSQVFGKAVPLSEKSESVTEMRGTPAAGPGVVPNTSRSITTGGTVDKMEKTVTESTSVGKVDSTVTTSQSPRNGIKNLSVSVNVPRSYLAGIYKTNHNDEEPTDEQLRTAGAKKDIEDMVSTALGTEDEDKVTVRWYPDGANVSFDKVAEAGTGEGMVALFRSYGSKMGMGALALAAFFMMMMMVRRVGEGPILPGEEPPQKIIRVGGGRKGKRQQEEYIERMGIPDAPIGEAAATEQLLVGREVDAETLQLKRTVDQIMELVEDDPETSVGILKQWIESDRK